MDWADVDNALRELGELTRTLTELETAHNTQTALLKTQFEASAKGIRERIAAKEKAMEKFVKAHKKEMGPRKSTQLDFGTVKLRLSTWAIKFKKTKTHTLSLVAAGKLKKYLTVKVGLNVEAMHGMTDEQLASVDARRSRGVIFSYELADDFHASEKSAGNGDKEK